jgi:hypothetical protein
MDFDAARRQPNLPMLSAPNVDLNRMRPSIQSPQFNMRAPVLDIDAPALHYNKPSYKGQRSDLTGRKTPGLDGNVNLQYRMSPEIHPRGDRHGHNNQPNRHGSDPNAYVFGSDLNIDDLDIDDFTGRDHVPRSRAPQRDPAMGRVSGGFRGPSFNVAAPRHQSGGGLSQSYGVSPAGFNMDPRDPRHQVYRRSAEGPRRTRQPSAKLPTGHRKPSDEGYFVTVFPTQGQNGLMQNRRPNTLGRLDFNPPNMDLEVPDANEDGSTFWFSKLI